MKTIQLSRGLSTIVDDEDYDTLSRLSWYAVDGGAGNFYAVHTYWEGKKSFKLKIHRLITNAPKGMEVDHINGDQLDNRKSNLKVCSHAENMKNYSKPKNNTSGVVGVQRSGDKWVATRQHKGKLIFFGRYATVEEAAIARLNGLKLLEES